jgi:hypothetical protein
MRIPDLLKSPQLNQRGTYDDVLYGETIVRLPGRFAIFSETPINSIARDATESRRNWAEPRRVAMHEGEEDVHGVFAGLKVADFTWAAAGPIITKCLADHGATVIRVESTTHPDSIRLGGPFKDGIPGLNRSGFFADFNTNKKSIALDMTTERGRSIARRLVAWSDVVTESYTPGVMARLRDAARAAT